MNARAILFFLAVAAVLVIGVSVARAGMAAINHAIETQRAAIDAATRGAP